MSNDATNITKSVVTGNYQGKNIYIVSILTGSEEPWHCKKLARNGTFDSREHKEMIAGSEQGEILQRVFMCAD